MSLDIPDEDRDTALHLACSSGHVRIVEMLLSAGADIFLPAKRRRLPLHLAVQSGSAALVDLLCQRYLEHPESQRIASQYHHHSILDAQCKEDMTAMHFAAQNGDLIILKMLIDYGASVLTVDEVMTYFFFSRVHSDYHRVLVRLHSHAFRRRLQFPRVSLSAS